MTKVSFGLVAMALAMGGCEVKECDPDDPDCGIDDEDAGPDADSDTDSDTDADTDTDTDTGSDTDTSECDSATWDPVDDVCVDDGTILTCDLDVLSEMSCDDLCQTEQGMDGRCGVFDEGGYGCHCSDVTCVAGALDACLDDEFIERCVDGLAIQLSCIAECQAGGDADGVCNEATDVCDCF